MKQIVKMIIALVVFVLFGGTVGLLAGLIEIPWLSQEVSWLLFTYPWFIYFFEGILIVLGGLLLVSLIVVLSVSGQRKRLVVKNGKNRTEILKSTVEQIAEDAYSIIVHPDKTKMTVKLKRKDRVTVQLRIDVRSKSRFQPMAEEIEQRIQSALTKALEPMENHVSIHLREKDPTESSTFGKKQSRVV